MPDPETILLQTKLHRPRLPHDLVERMRLVKLLEHDAHQQLILVCAPAGFGKTTLVGAWLEHIKAGEGAQSKPLPAAWLSLDENDSDFELFLSYVIAALRTLFKDACEDTLALLLARQQPPQAMINATFSNDLEKLPGEFILVLDDYHTVHGLEVHNLLGELARHWPKTLHLVLISRINPPIPLGKLRAKGMVSEIRTRDLRFSQDEAAAYLSRSQSASLIQNALPILEQRFEGWPAGLHLAALSLRSESSQENILSTLSDGDANITGYLVDEVLTHQFPAIETFLMKTSILDRFCASLCEALIGESDPAWNARACLDWIERVELFIVPLDNRREWYRYHHLFQELLQKRLSAELTLNQVHDLHRRASAWFEEHGLVDEALHHALTAGDLDLAARQMSSGLREVLNREDRQTLERWLRLLPEELIQGHPELLMIKVWVLEFSWRLQLQAKTLQQVEGLLAAGKRGSIAENDLLILKGQIYAIKAQQAYFSNQAAQAIDLCQQALALLPASWTFVRGGAMLYLGLAMQANGQALAAEKLLLAEYEIYDDKTDAFGLLLLRTLGFIYLNTGQLEQVRKIVQVLLQGATHHRIAIMKNWGDWYLGLANYHLNELEAAAQHFSQIVENRYSAQISTYRDAVAGLALIHQIKGKDAEARQMVESISEFDLEQRGSEDERTRASRARLMILQGDLEGAGRWADAFSGLQPDQPLIWLVEPQATRARVLIARGADNDLHLALQILDVLYEIAVRTYSTRYQIEILAMRSLALAALGENLKADLELSQAIDLARPGGFIRPFVDLGQPMQRMLHRLTEQDPAPHTIRRILDAFPHDDESLPDGAAPPPARRLFLGSAVLATPLTPRELEILILLSGPLSLKEIALKLFISYATVKRHTINLYGKLGVNQRWKAVARAEELNILPPG